MFLLLSGRDGNVLRGIGLPGGNIKSHPALKALCTEHQYLSIGNSLYTRAEGKVENTGGIRLLRRKLDDVTVDGPKRLVGKQTVYTDRERRFAVSVNRNKRYKLAVAVEDFLTGGWCVVSAPAEVMPGEPVTIVVEHVH